MQIFLHMSQKSCIFAAEIQSCMRNIAFYMAFCGLICAANYAWAGDSIQSFPVEQSGRFRLEFLPVATPYNNLFIDNATNAFQLTIGSSIQREDVSLRITLGTGESEALSTLTRMDSLLQTNKPFQLEGQTFDVRLTSGGYCATARHEGILAKMKGVFSFTTQDCSAAKKQVRARTGND